jgi:hypothetical protein
VHLCSKFPTHQGDNGMIIPKVSIPMHALVATAVSSLISFWPHSDIFQLYAVILEWHTGAHQANEFSANVYMDVYQGHINTLNHIWEHCNNAFHLIMADIYSWAKWVSPNHTLQVSLICITVWVMLFMFPALAGPWSTLLNLKIRWFTLVSTTSQEDTLLYVGFYVLCHSNCWPLCSQQ